MKTLGITGLRPQKLPWGFDSECDACIKLQNALRDKIDTFYNDGYRQFITGMALGADTWFAIEVLYLMSEHDDVTLDCYLPFRGQENSWSAEDKATYLNILHECNYIKVVDPGYRKDSYIKRDKLVVDNCDAMISIWDKKTPGGTSRTIAYARQKGVPVYNINPLDYWEEE